MPACPPPCCRPRRNVLPRRHALPRRGSPAAADGLPGMRGHDHTGITVPDMNQAIDFFTDVLGCKAAMTFGPFADDKGTFMSDVLARRPARP